MGATKRKIILMCYRATGKSVVGKKLAARLGLDFIDMDREIEARQACSIRQMVAEQGWDFFRSRERQLLAELVPRDAVVVATGGGAVLHQDIWPQLMASSFCVWLTADRHTICRRLANDGVTSGQRPSLTGDDICTEVGKVLGEREPLYRAGSHLAVDTANQTPDEAAAAICAAYESWNCRQA